MLWTFTKENKPIGGKLHLHQSVTMLYHSERYKKEAVSTFYQLPKRNKELIVLFAVFLEYKWLIPQITFNLAKKETFFLHTLGLIEIYKHI